MEEHGGEIACVILEPVMGNMGVVLPQEAFLKGLQDLCRAKGILLICDEVITGFRVTYGGAQHLYGLTPDLTCLGKIIGGGFPIGAFGGRREIMERLAPLGGHLPGRDALREPHRGKGRSLRAQMLETEPALRPSP